MQNPALSIILSIILPSVFAQTSAGTTTPKFFRPKEATIYYKLGERVIQIKTFQYGDVKDMVYINLHDDEITAVNGAKKILEKKGGFLIKIENYRTRNIKFKLEGKYYTVDPNRMFSRIGIARSLIIFGKTSPKAIDEIEKFANRILQLIPQNPSCIIALHNNGNGRYSVNSYLPGGERQKDAKALSVNQELDADDFFLTTDSIYYSLLAGEKYNTILQDNERAKKDGSLSIYCGEKNIHYVNCETENGRQTEYDEMIVTAEKYIERRNPDIITYNYRILPSSGHFSPKNKTEIQFGEKKVGRVVSAITDSSWTVAGNLEMNKNFPLYSNMDFFLFISPTNPPRLEVRVDPTRGGKLLDPAAATIIITEKGVK